MNVKVNRAGLRDHHATPRNGCTTILPALKSFHLRMERTTAAHPGKFSDKGIGIIRSSVKEMK